VKAFRVKINSRVDQVTTIGKAWRKCGIGSFERCNITFESGSTKSVVTPYVALRYYAVFLFTTQIHNSDPIFLIVKHGFVR